MSHDHQISGRPGTDLARPTLVAGLRYRDMAAAIHWLCSAFGFKESRVLADEDGAVIYAELAFGNGMIMLGAVQDSDLDQMMKQPDEIGGAVTQSCYFVVNDIEAHYATAKASGANIVVDLADDRQGGRGYSCRDVEGHLWSFGNYDPWLGRALADTAARETPLEKNSAAGPSDRSWTALLATRPLPQWLAPVAHLWNGISKHAALTAAVALVGAMIAAAGVGSWLFAAIAPHDRTETSSKTKRVEARLKHATAARALAKRAAGVARLQLVAERRARKGAERAAQIAQDTVETERAAKMAAEKAASDARDELAKERTAKDAAEQVSRQLGEEFEKKQVSRRTAARAASMARFQRAAEKRARKAAEYAAQTAREAVEAERSAKKAAERAASDARDELAKERTAKSAAEQASRRLSQELEEERTARQTAERAATSAQEELATGKSTRAEIEEPSKDTGSESAKAPSTSEATEVPAKEQPKTKNPPRREKTKSVVSEAPAKRRSTTVRPERKPNTGAGETGSVTHRRPTPIDPIPETSGADPP